MTVVVVTGSRGWTDADAICSHLERLADDHRGDVLIVHGGAPGADTIAGSVAYRLGLHVATVPALWHVHGKAAGPVRNRRMLDLEPALVLAFSLGTEGTRDTVEEARRRGLTVEVIDDAEETPA